jgi:hypothetical protein
MHTARFANEKLKFQNIQRLIDFAGYRTVLARTKNN